MSDTGPAKPTSGATRAPAKAAHTAAATPAAPSVPARAPAAPGHSPQAPYTLAIDIGGTGLKASLLDATGAMVADRVVVKTTYPCPPSKMVDDLAELVAPLPPPIECRRGFPGWSATAWCSRRRIS